MYGLDTDEPLLVEEWQGTLGDYVTAIAWASTSNSLAASSAAGEVVLWTPDALIELQTSTEQAIDCLGISPDGQFLVAGGQNGQVRVWHLASREVIADESSLLPATSKHWVDRLAWSPKANHLAVSCGRSVQVWDTQSHQIIATLPFEASSVLGISWHPEGQYLAVCGHRGVKIWHAQDWEEPPYILDVRAATIAIAWSFDGKYLAVSNMDRTLMVLDWYNPSDPWVMRGFPAKIRQLAWSQKLTTDSGAPLLAASCAASITIWEKLEDDRAGWDTRVLELHEDIVQAIAFQPHTFVLASAADDGYLCLWQSAQSATQVFPGASSGFSCLAWHPQGNYLGAGGQNGELLILSQYTEA
ncbi:MAG: hypothetical protein KME06_10355 [Kastovskya adunca ATA6-11-RM4]|nr:hypothetical protein [Kastovskya adunca ATA6-11-RM4]